jgi:hypothetical protein
MGHARITVVPRQSRSITPQQARAEDCKRATRGSFEHTSAVGLLADTAREVIEPFAIH